MFVEDNENKLEFWEAVANILPVIVNTAATAYGVVTKSKLASQQQKADIELVKMQAEAEMRQIEAAKQLQIRQASMTTTQSFSIDKYIPYLIGGGLLITILILKK